MRIQKRLLLALLLATTAWAQAPKPAKPSPAGPPPLVKFLPLPDTHAARLGGTISGASGQGVRPGARPIYVAPYFNPYVGGGYYPTQSAPPVIVYSQPPVEQPPVIMVNPDYRQPEKPRPVMSEYTAESKPYANLPQPGQTVYLLALKDGSLRQAVAFWRESASLHYVQPDHKQDSIAVGTLDRESTQRFNRERGIEIKLPE